jgi:hypothetical protein
LVGGLTVALLLVGVAVVYAGTRSTEDREAGPTEPAGVDQPSALPPIPPGLPPTEQAVDLGWALCMEIQVAFDDTVGVDLDYAEALGNLGNRLRALEAPTAGQQALLDELVDEVDAAAQMVEDDPTVEYEANRRADGAHLAFIDAGGCG